MLCANVQSEIFQSNEPLCGDDEIEHRYSLAQGLHELEKMHQHISEVSAHFSSLMRQFQRYKDAIRENKKLICGFRNMPIELVSQIMLEFVLMGNLDNDGFITQRGPRPWNMMEGPWILTKVCRQWRDIALGYPELWSYIVVGDVFDGISNPSLTAVHTHIERSRTFPLNVHIYEVHNPGSWSCTFEELIHPILDASSRWRFASIQISPGMQMHLAPINNRLDELRSLRIRFDRALPISVAIGIDLFKSVPSLRQLYILDEAIGEELRNLFPFRNLAHLSYFQYTYGFTNIFDVLEQCTSITSLHLDGACIVQGDIVLPALRVLELGDLEDGYSTLSKLTFPALESLSLKFDAATTRNFGQIEKLLSRSKTPLRTLKIYFHDQHQDDFMSFFEERMPILLSFAPDLTTLDISYQWYGNDMWDEVAERLISLLVKEHSDLDLVPVFPWLSSIKITMYPARENAVFDPISLPSAYFAHLIDAYVYSGRAQRASEETFYFTLLCDAQLELTETDEEYIHMLKGMRWVFVKEDYGGRPRT
jgi:hypothetical protein